jgi:hypothetical protein
VDVAIVRVKKQVRFVHDFHVVFGGQDAGEIVVGFVQVRPKIAEININWRFGRHLIIAIMCLHLF